MRLIKLVLNIVFWVIENTYAIIATGCLVAIFLKGAHIYPLDDKIFLFCWVVLPISGMFYKMDKIEKKLDKLTE